MSARWDHDSDNHPTIEHSTKQPPVLPASVFAWVVVLLASLCVGVLLVAVTWRLVEWIWP